MDPITIASIIALLGGTAMQYKASSDARDRANAAAQRGLLEQAELQKQAEQRALATAQNFNADNRNQQQAQLEDQAQQVLMQPVQATQEQHAQAADRTGAASSDYVKAKAAADANTMSLARQMAGWMAKTTGANRLRTNEAINLADAAAGIDRLANNAQHMGQVSQLEMQGAARPDAGLMLGGSLLQGAGMMGAAGSFGKAASTAGNAGQGLQATASTSSNLYAPITEGGGQVGLNVPYAQSGGQVGLSGLGGSGTGFRALPRMLLAGYGG